MNYKGITLISLIITVIVMVMLAGVTITIALGDNGILNLSMNAVELTQQASLEEDVSYAIIERNVNKYKEDKSQELGYYLSQIENANVVELSTIAWYVTRGSAEVIVYNDGETMETLENWDVWDGKSSEVPEVDGDSWYIYTSAQFKFLADFVNNGNSLTDSQKTMVAETIYDEADIYLTTNSTVYLMSNLDLGARQVDGTLTEGVAWYPIGTGSSTAFISNFDGNNHVIQGVYMKCNYAGLFWYVKGNIANLTIKDSYIYGSSGFTGGIVGDFWGDTAQTLENCYNINTYVGGGGICVGGVCGLSKSGSTLLYCGNTGTVSGTSYVGGVIGDHNGNEKGGFCLGCGNSGSVYGTNCAGGVFGFAGGYSNISYCFNKGTVQGNGDDGASGIINLASNYPRYVSYCFNSGKILSSTQTAYCSGIGPFSYSDSTFSYCYNSGYVNTTDYSGAILGLLYSDSIISHCYYTYQDGLSPIGNVADGYTADLQSAIDACTKTDTVLTTYYEFIEWINSL